MLERLCRSISAGLAWWKSQKIAILLFELSLYCAVLTVALLSLDESPLFRRTNFPARPAYILGTIGACCWFFSCKWFGLLRKNRSLLVLVGCVAVWGAVATLLGCARNGLWEYHDSLLQLYKNWRVLPLVFLLWFAFAFAAIPPQRARKLFCWGLLLLLLPNLIHITLEVFANFGATEVKKFLMDVNHLFRKEKIAHGWWPPVYFENRIRGLFAEPSHMAFSLIPVFAYVCYKARRSMLLLPAAAGFLAVYFLSKTGSGLVDIGVFCFLLVVLNTAIAVKKRVGIMAAMVALIVLSGFSMQYYVEKQDAMRTQLQNMQRITTYCREANAGKAVEPPVLDYRNAPNGSTFTRLTTIWLDVGSVTRFPLGTGFFERGFYWQPLEKCDFQDAEIGLWVQQAATDPYRGVPQICEYTTLLAEFGYPGIAFSLALYLFIGVRCIRHVQAGGDAFAFFMTCAYVTMLVGALFISLNNAPLFFFLSGFLYALCGKPETGDGRRETTVPARG